MEKNKPKKYQFIATTNLINVGGAENILSTYVEPTDDGDILSVGIIGSWDFYGN